MTDDQDRRIEALYRAASKEEPPPRVDRRILEQSRRATASPLAKYTPFGGHWPLGLSWAAVVVITVSLLVYLADVNDPHLDGGAVTEEEAARRKAPSPAAEPPAPAQPEPARSPAPGREPPAAPRAAGKADEGAGAPADLGAALRERRSAAPPAPVMETQAQDMADRAADASAPAEQLRLISRLLKAGEPARARRLLADFVARHPDHPLPPELAALLPRAD